MKTAAAHLASLQDGREVYIHGERVADVTTHPAFRNAVANAAYLYEFQSRPENRDQMMFSSPTSGDLVSRCWQLPETYAELVERRRALTAWAETHYGFMGRSPDHVASCLAGMYMGIDQFEAFDRDRAAALRDYFEYARDRDLYLTYAIINPQAERSASAAGQPGGFHAARICRETAGGVIISGSKMLATSAIMANEVFVTCIQPLGPGDERYAISFAVPMNAKGLKILSRKSYEAGAPSIFDNPLSSRFDENDAVLYFDDVRVPWDRIFAIDDRDMIARQFHATPAHVYQNYQAQIRLAVKLKFLLGIAHRTTQVNGTGNFPQVKEQLGQLAAEVTMIDAFISAMEAKGSHYGLYFIPDRHTLYAAQTMAQQLYGKVVTTIRELAGGGVIMLPSSVEDFGNPEIAPLIGKTQQSPVASAQERVKFFKLAWDAIGSEFASRHTQYEMFYAGASFVVKGHAYRTFDWPQADGLLDRMLSSYRLEDEVTPARAEPAE